MPSSSEKSSRPGEFELIAKLFAPLADDFPGAFGLTDDAAVFAAAPGTDLVLKTDSLIESVHFLRNDPPFDVSRKALRRALSDLAAKGAKPRIYLLALALPDWPDALWLKAFADGLAFDQKIFGISLAGGETNATPGPLVATITAIGEIPSGTMTRRCGARLGDAVFVTGTIGDAAAGLLVAQDGVPGLSDAEQLALVMRYRLPEPRMAFGCGLRGIASAALDVSDGLVADLGHIAEVSNVRIEIEAAHIPLQGCLGLVWPNDNVVVRAATAGDDYEIAFTAPGEVERLIADLGSRAATRVTRIGRVVEGKGVALTDSGGLEIPIIREGYTHF